MAECSEELKALIADREKRLSYSLELTLAGKSQGIKRVLKELGLRPERDLVSNCAN